MTVGEFDAWLDRQPIGHAYLMAALTRDLEMSVAEVESRMSDREIRDWSVLYDVEAEAGASEQKNAENRQKRG